MGSEVRTALQIRVTLEEDQTGGAVPESNILMYRVERNYKYRERVRIGGGEGQFSAF